jgi:hypothetical protein
VDEGNGAGRLGETNHWVAGLFTVKVYTPPFSVIPVGFVATDASTAQVAVRDKLSQTAAEAGAVKAMATATTAVLMHSRSRRGFNFSVGFDVFIPNLNSPVS